MSIEDLMGTGVPPIVAILRGIRPVEALEIGGALMDAGIHLIEVPLNSPEPLLSISALQTVFGNRAMIGAGTVVSCDGVDAAADAGARFIVTPNTDPDVIRRAVARGLEAMPGFFTASEAFAAMGAGARRLKLFPASSSPPGHIKALREVLPPDVQIWAVGGTGAANIATWIEHGVFGIGVGGGLYRPGDSTELVGRRARDLVAAWNGVKP
jgi:2-dehydro-3-deoxyphosphogalactonate aldolase